MSNQKKYLVIGIMSGTSMDGLDLSLIKTDGVNYLKILDECSYQYSLKYRNKLKKIIHKLPKLKQKQFIYSKNNEEFITKEILKIIKKFLKKINYINKKIDLIGLSGQTIIHNPKKKYSIQLGSGEYICDKLKIPVISNFRDNDIKSGGQGAPIGCSYHEYLLRKIDKKAAIINIGGVSNITLIHNNKLIGFDIGPGNAIIDDLTNYFYKKKFDRDGLYAKKGILLKGTFNKFKNNYYFNKKYPKSLDRNHFKKVLENLKSYNANDAIYTASQMTIYSIMRNVNFFKNINKIILTGGGRNNIFIASELLENLNKKNIKLLNIDQFGLNGDMLEAQMFGYLAVRTLKKLPISFPLTTGVKKQISGGVLYDNY